MVETQKKNLFIMKNPENGDYNQYWYSPKTIEIMVDQCEKHSKKGAYLSTPSIFYNLSEDLRKESYLFEFDKKFEKKNPNFVFYDFKQPDDIPEKFNNFFDFVLIDPPFITRDVWELYAKAGLKIIKKDENNVPIGKFLVSTIDENKDMLKELLNLEIRKCRPSIPNLVYQYSLYSNYEDDQLNSINEEIGF